MENKEFADKECEIREYSVRENIFFTTLVASEIPGLFERMHKSEVMAVVIEIAEQFDIDFPNGSVEQLEEYAKAKFEAIN